MTLTHDALSDLEALAYEAALEPSLWPQVVADASRAFEAPYMMLNVSDRRGKKVMHAAPPGVDELAEVTMARYPTVETNPGLAFAALAPPTAVGLRDRIVSDSDLERLEFYQDILRPLDLWHAAIMNVHRDDAVLAPMAFMRARKEGPFGDGEVAALRALAPHFNRALRVTLRLRELEARASALAEMTDRALVALVLTDAFGRIAEANSVGARHSRRSRRAPDPRRRTPRGPKRRVRQARAAHSRGGGIAPHADERRHAGLATLRPASARARRLADPQRPPRPSAARTPSRSPSPIRSARPNPTPICSRELYGFTAREAGVAALLLQGLSPSEAAGELAMTENTVRTHIRHLFDKTGVERLRRPRAPSHAGAGRSRALTYPPKVNRSISPILVISRGSCSTKVLAAFNRRRPEARSCISGMVLVSHVPLMAFYDETPRRG